MGKRQKIEALLVSAVIPTHNRPDLVCRAVRSALNQTYSSLEVVVVVDGPDPITVSALEALCEPRLRIVALVENVGGCEARNIGVREARGEFVALLDDDDEWLPSKINKQIEAFYAQKSPHCLIGSIGIIKRPGRRDIVLPKRTPPVLNNEPVSEYMFCASGRRRIAGAPQTPGYFARRDLFLCNPFAKALKCNQEAEWFLRVMSMEYTCFCLLNEPLYIVHRNPCIRRTSDNNTWESSLEFLDYSANLFTPKAYTSFVIHGVMHRCTDITNRRSTFQLMLERCRRQGSISTWDIIHAVKWYIFPPQLRSLIRTPIIACVRCLISNS